MSAPWLLLAGLYQTGPRNQLFDAWTLFCWVANACYQAAIMFAMVIKATPAIYADRSSGKTFSHWEVGRLCRDIHFGYLKAQPCKLSLMPVSNILVCHILVYEMLYTGASCSSECMDHWAVIWAHVSVQARSGSITLRACAWALMARGMCGELPGGKHSIHSGHHHSAPGGGVSAVLLDLGAPPGHLGQHRCVALLASQIASPCRGWSMQSTGLGSLLGSVGMMQLPDCNVLLWLLCCHEVLLLLMTWPPGSLYDKHGRSDFPSTCCACSMLTK